jgi:hypothetical protein
MVTQVQQMTARPVYDRIEAVAPRFSREATLVERMQWCSRTLDEVLADQERARRATVNQVLGLATDLGLTEAVVAEMGKAAETAPVAEVVRMLRTRAKGMRPLVGAMAIVPAAMGREGGGA